MSYNLALKETTSFVDQILNCGYVDQQMYNEFVDKLASTGNIYDIQLESHEKVLSEESEDVYNEQYKIAYNKDIFADTGVVENDVNKKALRNGCYYLNEGDQFYVRLKNTNTTMAGAIFNTIVPTSKKERIVVNYGGIVKNTSWDLVRQEYNALQYLYSVDVEVYIDGELQSNYDELITITKGEPSYVKYSEVNLEITLKNTDNKFERIIRNGNGLTKNSDYTVELDKIVLNQFKIEEDNIIQLHFQDQSLKTTVKISNSEAGSLQVNGSAKGDEWDGYFNKDYGFDIKIVDNKITLINKKDTSKTYTIECDLEENFNIRGFKINGISIANGYNKSNIKEETKIEIVVGKDGIAEDIYFWPHIKTNFAKGEKWYYYNLENNKIVLRSTWLVIHRVNMSSVYSKDMYDGELKLVFRFVDKDGKEIKINDEEIFFDSIIKYDSIGYCNGKTFDISGVGSVSYDTGTWITGLEYPNDTEKISGNNCMIELENEFKRSDYDNNGHISYAEIWEQYKLSEVDKGKTIQEKAMLNVELVMYIKDADGNKLYIQAYPNITKTSNGLADKFNDVKDIKTS